MSHSTYGRMWAEAQGALHRILEEELPEVPPQPQKDRLLAFQSLATFYVKYLQILHSLEAVYDQMVHPQKRRVVRQVLDGVTGRLLELKNEMVELEFSEFHYYDDLLQDLKLTPEDLEIPIPRYFLGEKLRVLQEREKLLASILARGDRPEPKADVQVWSLAMEEAVRLLQVAERARQGRLRASFMKEIRREEERYLHGRNHDDSAVDHDAAATLIQKVWRGFSTRKRMRRERLEEMVFLGMIPPPQQGGRSVAEARLQQVEVTRRLLQEKHEEDFLQAQDGVRDSVRDIDGPDLQQTMQDQIRQWFIECRDATGKFPDYPSVDEGGSLAIFAQKTPEQLAADLAAKEEEKEKRKKDKAKKEREKSSGREGKEKKGKGKKKGKKGGADPEAEEKGWIMPPSSFLPAVMQGSKTYEEVWQNRDESQNLAQTFDVQLVREEKRAEVEAEVRVQVDELMRQELKSLKMVVERVKEKKKKGKKNSKKKKGKGSKRKKRREKDLSADRTMESLYEELVLGRFLIKPQSVKLSDYIGEYSYLGTTLRQTDIEPMPSLSDVRQLVALYGVLPLGSQVVHERAPQVKALLLAGPAGVGKRMLVHAVCAETGANLFNLSPANLAGRYPGRSGLQYLLHVVFKVARALQPSVIWIGDAEKTFYKKVPKSEKEFEPKRLKKDLPKLLKQLRPEDRVLIVGTTRRPFDADLKPFCKVYRKIILIPRPDYATRLAIWRHSLMELGVTLTPDLDLSSLAKVTDGYTQGSILQAAQAVLTKRRLDIQTQRPLRALEFISPLARQDPVYKEEEETFKAWYSRTPLGKKRARASKASQEGGETGDGIEKAGKGKKKGKEAKGKGQKKKKKK